MKKIFLACSMIALVSCSSTTVSENFQKVVSKTKETVNKVVETTKSAPLEKVYLDTKNQKIYLASLDEDYAKVATQDGKESYVMQRGVSASGLYYETADKKTTFQAKNDYAIFSKAGKDYDLTEAKKELYKSEKGENLLLLTADNYETAMILFRNEMKSYKIARSASGILLRANDKSEFHFKKGEGVYRTPKGEEIFLNKVEK